MQLDIKKYFKTSQLCFLIRASLYSNVRQEPAQPPSTPAKHSHPKPLGVEGDCGSLYLKSPKLAEKLSRLTKNKLKSHKVTQEKAKTKKSNVVSCGQGFSSLACEEWKCFLNFFAFLFKGKDFHSSFYVYHD